MTLLILAIALVTLYYVSPLILLRLKTKKVKVKLKSLEGNTSVTTLYLSSDDPLWKAIQAHTKGVNNAD